MHLPVVNFKDRERKQSQPLNVPFGQMREEKAPSTTMIFVHMDVGRRENIANQDSIFETEKGQRSTFRCCLIF